MGRLPTDSWGYVHTVVVRVLSVFWRRFGGGRGLDGPVEMVVNRRCPGPADIADIPG